MSSRVIPRNDFTGGEITGDLAAREDLRKYNSGLKLLKNFVVRAHGGVRNRPGTAFVGPIADESNPAALLPFTFSTQDTYVLEFGEQTMRVIRNGGYVTTGPKTITGATAADPVVITAAAHGFADGDMAYIAGIGGMVDVDFRFFQVANATTNSFSLQDNGVDVDGSAFAAFTAGGAVSKVFTLGTPWTADDVRDLRIAQSTDELTVTHKDYAVRIIARTDHDAWTIETLTVGATIAAPTGLSMTGSTHNYVVTAENDDGEESEASTAVQGASDQTLSWSAVAGAVRYYVYKQSKKSGRYGFIGSTTNLSLLDDNFAPDFDDGPPVVKSPFGAPGDYPAVCGYFEQRAIFAATNDAPNKWFGSQSAQFRNFNTSEPLKASDAINRRLVDSQFNEIRGIVTGKNLILLTSNAEWKIEPADGNALAADAPDAAHPVSRWGSAKINPLQVGEQVLILQDDGRKVRELTPDRLDDSQASGIDLSIISDHLLRLNTISRWTYAKAPDSIVWSVRDDGRFLSMTYHKEHEVSAWAQHETDGEVEDVCSVREGSTDAVYLLVKRTINGVTRRYVERMADRDIVTLDDCWFVDCGFKYVSETAQTVFNGLHHLEGKTVSILADGNVKPQQVVTNGRVTIAVGAKVVHIGLPYTSQFETLPTVMLPEMPSAGVVKGSPEFTLLVRESRGIFGGTSFDKLFEYKQRQNEAYGEAIALFTGPITLQVSARFRRDDTYCVQQSDPLPLTLLSMAPRISYAS